MPFSLSRIIDDDRGDNDDGNDVTADKDDAESRDLASRYLNTFWSIQ